jgi:hypothetical protein
MLKQVAAHSETNMMDAHNLAIVIAPNILYAKGSADYLKSSDPCAVVDSLISLYDKVLTETISEQEAIRTSVSVHRSEATVSRRERLRRLASKKEILLPEGAGGTATTPTAVASGPLLSVTTITGAPTTPSAAAPSQPSTPEQQQQQQQQQQQSIRMPMAPTATTTTAADGSATATESHSSEGSLSSSSAVAGRPSNASETSLPDLKMPAGSASAVTESSLVLDTDSPSPSPMLDLPPDPTLPRVVPPQAMPIEGVTSLTSAVDGDASGTSELLSSSSVTTSSAEKRHKRKHRHTTSDGASEENGGSNPLASSSSSRRRKSSHRKADTLGRPRKQSIDDERTSDPPSDDVVSPVPDTLPVDPTADPESVSAALTSMTLSVLGESPELLIEPPQQQPPTELEVPTPNVPDQPLPTK